MNSFSRIPFYAWYLFSVVYCYLIWNPWGFSLWTLVQSNVDLAVKALALVVSVTIAALYIVEGHRSMNAFGIFLFCALFGSLIWLAYNHGFRGLGNVDIWGQWLVGFLMTIALQGGRVYRSMTGRVPVGTGATDDAHHGHH